MPTTLKPPQSVQEAAKRAQKWLAEGFAGSGFTDVGRARMGQLARGEAVSAETVRRMKAYFDRHVSDKDAPDFGNVAKPSAGRVAWDAWGGDAGRAWAESVVERLERQESAREDGTRLDAVRLDDVPAHLRRFLRPPEPTPQGTWRVEGVLAVEGVKRYPWGGELVRADALKDPLYLASLAGLVLTEEHPDGLVTPDNAQRTDTGERVLSARWDEEARALIGLFELRRKDGLRGLSVGNHPVEVKAGAGTWGALPYVAEQVRLRANHVARTDAPRIKDAGLRLDAAPAVGGAKMEEVEIEIDGVKYKVPKAVAEAVLKMREDMIKAGEEKPKMDSLRGENAALKEQLASFGKEVKRLTDDLDARRLDALKADLAQGKPAEVAAAIKAAKNPADAYRAALPAPVLARLDAADIKSEEGFRAAWQASQADATATASNVGAQVSAVQAAQRADAVGAKPDPVGRFHVPPKFDRDALAKKGA